MVEAPYIPSPMKAITTALDLAKVGPGDILYDLGAGDGRVVVEAAKRGAYAVAVEIDPYLTEVIRERVRSLNLSDRVTVIEGSFYEIFLGYATVIYTYLFMSINERLSSKYESELRPGTRIVTLDFPIPGWIPVRVKRIIDEAGIVRTIFLYIMGLSNPSSLVRRRENVDYRLLGRLLWSRSR